MFCILGEEDFQRGLTMKRIRVNVTNHQPEVEKDELIYRLTDNLNQLQKRFQAEEDDEERNWMMKQTDNPAVITFLKSCTVMMLHVLDAIGELEPVNGVRISQRLDIPRGSISKITRKLVDENVIQAEYLPDNKKTILFRTTPLGKEIFRIHQTLHRIVGTNVHAFLSSYDTQQLSFLIQVLEDILKTSWVKAEESLDPVEGGQIAAAGTKSGPRAKDDPMPDIQDILHRLDEASLNKVRNLLMVLFLDASVSR